MAPAISVAQGSSPHTRGAPEPGACHEQAGRIIPAYAGSTPTRWRKPDSDADHPRIRGEHPTPSTASRRKRGSSPHTRGARGAARRQLSRLGSSPHTRGARPGVLPFSPGAGIIPAYAGSTCRSASGTKTRTDHPRIRGEHPGRGDVVNRPAGSSPHTRGARVARA